MQPSGWKAVTDQVSTRHQWVQRKEVIDRLLSQRSRMFPLEVCERSGPWAIKPLEGIPHCVEVSREPRPAPSSQIEEPFRDLAHTWRSETEQSSDAEAVLLHPAYQRIIGMGEPVLPLIFRELQHRPDLWYWALKMITGDDPVPPDAETMREVREAWLDYGRRRGYL